MMRSDSKTRAAVALAAAALAATAATIGAQTGATGQSFTTLSSGYSQELYATTQLAADDPSGPSILGGVAFAPNGDPWVAECVFSHTVLHRFANSELLPEAHGTTSRHRESMTVPTQGGCGLSNNADGSLYSNSQDGVWKLNASSGQPVAGPIGPRGNALGITADPKTGHVVYAAA